MDENGKAVYPELKFQYMIIQAWPDKNYVFYYLDGSQSRRTLNIPAFMQMVTDHWPALLHDIYDVCRTTSFYLLNLVDMTVTHLHPHSDIDTPYLDSIRNVVEGTKSGKRVKSLITEKLPLEQVLMQYGFSTPSKNSVENLTVSLEKRNPEKEGFLSRFLNRNSRG